MPTPTPTLESRADYLARRAAARSTIRAFSAILLVACMIIGMSAAAARPPDSEIIALETIGIDLGAYNTTTNVWNNHHGWTENNPPDDPCGLSWFGVICDAGGHHITGLSLPNNNVHGVMPDASLWGQLPQMTLIALSNNFISGSVPDLTVMPLLEEFIVPGDTSIFGQFPAYLNGTIPPLTGLTHLDTFNVGDNHINGSIPDLSTLTSLSTFDVGGNQLSGSIPDLTNNTALFSFMVDNNYLTGSLPALAQATGLHVFQAFNNYLTGNIPPIASLQNLHRFYVGGNSLTGPMPDIHNMAALDDIDLSYNQLTGPMPCLGLSAPCSSGLPLLAVINVSHNQISGPFPTLDGLDFLSRFSIGYNRITGQIKALPAPQQQMISVVCPNPMDLTPQPSIDPNWSGTIQGNPFPWWGPAGADNSCDLILRAEFD